MAIAQILSGPHQKITEEEFSRRPRDGRRWELVEGEAKELPAGHEHDAIGVQVAVLLKPHTKGRGVLAGARAGFRMKSGNLGLPMSPSL